MTVWWLVWWACAAPRPVEPVLALTGDARRGEATYQMECARCHGAEGFGVASTPALADRAPLLSDAQVVEVVLHGKGGMGAQRLSDAQVADVLSWLRERWPAARR